MTYQVIWGIVIVVSLVVEALTVALVSIWFALSGVLALIVSILGFGFEVQLIVFIAASILFLFLFISKRDKFLNKENIKTNLDTIIGKVGVVRKKIEPHKYGEVHVEGKTWTAINEKKEEILNEGEKVIIQSISGVKLIVRKTN